MIRPVGLEHLFWSLLRWSGALIWSKEYRTDSGGAGDRAGTGHGVVQHAHGEDARQQFDPFDGRQPLASQSLRSPTLAKLWLARVLS